MFTEWMVASVEFKGRDYKMSLSRNFPWSELYSNTRSVASGRKKVTLELHIIYIFILNMPIQAMLIP